MVHDNNSEYVVTGATPKSGLACATRASRSMDADWWRSSTSRKTRSSWTTTDWKSTASRWRSTWKTTQDRPRRFASRSRRLRAGSSTRQRRFARSTETDAAAWDGWRTTPSDRTPTW